MFKSRRALFVTLALIATAAAPAYARGWQEALDLLEARVEKLEAKTRCTDNSVDLTFPRKSCPGRMLRFGAGREEGEAHETEAPQPRTDHRQAA
jgi:hypothetical protein